MQLLDLKQTDITQSLFYQEIEQEGLQKGRQEGRQEEAAALVLRQLTRRMVLSVQAVSKKFCRSLKRSPIAVAAHLLKI